MRVRPFSNSSHLYSDSKHKHRGHTFMIAALDLEGRYVNPFSNPLDAEVTYACTAPDCILISDVPPADKVQIADVEKRR